MTDKVLAHWVQKLSKFYWSPETPQTYLVPHYKTNVPVGLGRVALNSPGSFNLTWAYVKGKLSTYADHLTAVTFFSKAALVNVHVVDGIPLEEWLTLYDKEEYQVWYAANSSRLPTPVRELHDKALHTHEVRKL